MVDLWDTLNDGRTQEKRMANKSNKKKLKISLSEQPDIFNQLEEAMQPVFETNHVAALGFLAIKDSGWLEQVLGSKFEGGVDMGSDLYLVPEESPTGKQMGLEEGQFWHKGIGQKQKIYVKQKGDNPLQFINMSALEYNSFVHELMHLGHMVLKDLLRENTSGIPELTTTRDPKIINMVGSAMDKDAAESFYKGDSWVESYRNFPEKKQDLWKRKGLGPPYMIKAEQYPNEVANIIARLYSGEDGKMQSLYNGFPLRGGERVLLKIAGNSDVNKEGLDFSKNPKDYFYVASITNVLIDSGKEIFTLNLVPREAITNETTRVGKKFPGSQPISDSVKNILKEYLKTDKLGTIDKTQNPYGFLGNLKNPFTILTWLSSKGVPATTGKNASAGYLFYQTKDGFNFRSIDDLIDQNPYKNKFVYTPNVVEDQDPRKNFKILNIMLIRYF